MADRTLFSLGAIYPSDFLKPGEEPRCAPVELKLVMDENGLVHLENTAPKEVLWGERYWYSSSVSGIMQFQLRDIVRSIFEVFEVSPRDIFLDIAGNDCYLLSQVPSIMTTVSIDPAGGHIYDKAKERCDVVIKEYFSKEVYREKMGVRNAKIISVVSMFYDLQNPDLFLEDVYDVLDKDGLFVIQLSYSPAMLLQCEISNICHEHIFYYSCYNIFPLFERRGFSIMDVTLNETNAGSFRIFAMKKEGDKSKLGSPSYRSMAEFRMESLRLFEKTAQFDEPEVWERFFTRAEALKKQTVDFINQEKAKGKVIMGYGASTKLNTILQYFGLTNEHITAIAERSPEKLGLRTVGSNIPIISEYDMRVQRPDYLLIGPTHFLQEFKKREKVLLDTGTKFIIIMPQFEIISS